VPFGNYNEAPIEAFPLPALYVFGDYWNYNCQIGMCKKKNEPAGKECSVCVAARCRVPPGCNTLLARLAPRVFKYLPHYFLIKTER